MLMERVGVLSGGETRPGISLKSSLKLRADSDGMRGFFIITSRGFKARLLNQPLVDPYETVAFNDREVRHEARL